MSELSAGYLWGIIAITAISALALRATPLLIKQRIAGSLFAHHLGLWLPLGAMVILLGYSITTLDYSSTGTALPYLVACLVTIGIHLWKRNVALSMIAGTLTCVILATVVLG